MGTDEKIPLIVVCGPTASGKTRAAIELALLYGGEVVCADSMQIYNELCICTARPTADEMKGVPHHLTGFVPPDKAYNVAQYVQDAAACIADIRSRGRIPIVCGGTGLYIDSLVNGISFDTANSDENLRKELEQRLANGDDLYRELMEKDAEAAARIHPNNVKRVIRFLEIVTLTGKSIAENERLSRSCESPYTAVKIGLTCFDRELLYDRINRRVDDMLAAGMVDEVRRVYERYSTHTAFHAIGYKELIPYIRGECELEEAVDLIKQSSRKYAKRQLTWFRRDDKIEWVDTSDYGDIDGIISKSKNIVEKSKIL
ncbi:MAG: tRNA (adenosine(37)-N6)-dimethylallyltransferase MiaA [Oscillospiraceae bacterium]|nr:tRNA (adenosine(37)-N6)-dimethylallyltransferase MiaA [Oscillospiraceae bacterium]